MAMLKGFENLKNSVPKEDEFEKSYKIVEVKLKSGKEPKPEELRKWFIYYLEQKYQTKLLGTNIHYCYKTFNKLKDKYSLSNFELCRRLSAWSERYHKLGYDSNGNTQFTFSSLNTDWLIERLENNIPNNSNGKEVTYKINNKVKIDTKDRRI